MTIKGGLRWNPSQFRSNFTYPATAKASWFPGHMFKSLKQLQHLLTITDLVVEVHDARIPFSGRNSTFKQTLTGSNVRPHILVLNKKDLAFNSSAEKMKVTEELKKRDPNLQSVLFTSCKSNQKNKLSNDPELSKLIPLCSEIISQSPRYGREANPDSNVLIIGVPNVGKSSVINHIRSERLKISGNATKVGANPGVTRALQTKIRVNASPPIYLWDSPGILMPSIPDVEIGLKLAVCKSLRDEFVGLITVSDYLLFCLNKMGKFKYVSVLKLTQPEDEIYSLLVKIAIKKEWILRIKSLSSNSYVRKPDIDKAADYFLRTFRKGKFGTLNLDESLLSNNNSSFNIISV